MADQLELALIAAEIAELLKQQSEANINAIYLGFTDDQRVASHCREDRIASLRLQLVALDECEPGLIRAAHRAMDPRNSRLS